MLLAQQLSDRQKALLQAIIDEYVGSAEPVSSRFLQQEGILDVSSATIRSEMMMLEQMGYLAHLHTSGGRVPTDKAYRYYVDTLEVDDIKLPERHKRRIHQAIEYANDDPQELNRVLARVLSELSDSVVITNITGTRDYVKIGLSELFSMPEFQEYDHIFGFTSFFDEFENLFERLNQHGLHEPNKTIRVMIGTEHPFDRVRQDTIMQSEYSLPRRLKGSVTVIGPTRMDYSRNIGLLRYIMERLSELYN